jgi:CheY-like chemotaxis protein
MRILMLEDSDTRIEMIQMQAERRGWDFTAVKTVDSFQVMVSSAYDVALLDHDLGYGPNGMDAVNFLCGIQTNRPGVVYVHSANCIRAPEMVKRLREAGYRAYQIDFLSLWEGMKDQDWEF